MAGQRNGTNDNDIFFDESQLLSGWTYEKTQRTKKLVLSDI